MNIGNVLKLFMIILGVLILIKTVVSLAKRKMTEQFCLVWAALSVLFVICGFLLKPMNLEKHISLCGFIFAMLIVIIIVSGAWFISIQVSSLIRKNQELAMQTSLLNHDSEYLISEIKSLKRQLSEIKQEKNTVDREKRDIG